MFLLSSRRFASLQEHELECCALNIQAWKEEHWKGEHWKEEHRKEKHL